MINETAKYLAELTCEKPLFIHLDGVALLSLGGKERVKNMMDYKLNIFNEILNKVEELGGNIIIPAFSYSATANEIYDIKNSPSKVGYTSDFLRKLNYNKRSKDAIFSYLIFSKNKIFIDEFKIKEFNSFGEGSIIDKVFKMDGYVGAIGDVLPKTTEFHYLEKKIGVYYRFDKKFDAKIKDLDGKIYENKVVFFCRKLELKKIAFFNPIIDKLKEKNLIKKLKINGLNLDYLSLNDAYEIMQKLYKIDKDSFLKDIEE
jgi:aminoglycoside N3'-acetyltransferase